MAEEFERNPFGLPDADTNLGQLGLGFLNIPDYLMGKSKQIGDAIVAAPGQLVDYLGAPTESGKQKLDLEAILNDPLGEFGGNMDLPQAPEFPILPLDPNLPPYDPSGLDVEFDAEQQAIERREIEDLLEKDRVASAEAFREKEAQLVETQGGLNSMSIAESEKAKSELNAQDGFMAAMDDFFEGARGAGPEVPKDRTIAEYKKAFSEATGIDTSGEVDKKDALMAFGLALMQNKAGKGFNVSKMLESVGEAGDAAMPALEKAKNRAREGALAGGKYALQTQSADKAVRAAAKEKMMVRDKYWVYQKPTDGSTFGPVDGGFNKGQFEDLSKYEMDKLINDPKFQEKYEFVSAADRMDVLKIRAEAAATAAGELGDQWGDKFDAVSLIGGETKDVPRELQVVGVSANPNYGGSKTTSHKLGEPKEDVVNRFVGFQENITRDSKVFDELIGLVDSGVTIQDQIVSKVVKFGRGFGIDMGGVSEITQAKQTLANIAIDEATRILQESGKTLSDADRALVRDRVSEISFANADGEQIKRQLKDIYFLVVEKAQKNLDTAISELDNKFGISISAETKGNVTKAELAKINKIRKQNGLKPRTMEEYNQ